MAAACLAPASDAGLVQGLLQSVDCNVYALVETGYGALASPGSQMAFVLTAMLTLYVAFLGLRLMLGLAPLNVGDLTLTVVKIGVVLALATNWPTYQQLVFGVLFQGPAEIAGSVMSSMHGADSVFRGNPFNGLQLAYDELQANAAFFAQRSNTLTSPLVGGNAFGAFALNVSAFAMLMTTLGVVLGVKIVLGMLLALGPVFVALLLFDTTRGVFEGWLRACLAFAFAPLFVILALAVQLTLIEPHLIRLAAFRAENVVDMASAVAIFTLTLITAGVSLAGLAAVAMIAGGFRFPSRAARSPAAASADARVVPASSQAVVDTNRAQTSEAYPRAAAIASAAAAMDRRELRLVAEGQSEGHRLSLTGRTADRPADLARPPVGRAYRRPAAPRRSASSARRDR